MPVLPILYRDSVTVQFEEPIIWKPGMSDRDVVAALEAEMRSGVKDAGGEPTRGSQGAIPAAQHHEWSGTTIALPSPADAETAPRNGQRSVTPKQAVR